MVNIFESRENVAALDELAKHGSPDLDPLLEKWTGQRGGWERIRGKRVLDLGSGSVFSLGIDIKDSGRVGTIINHPYFSRFCAALGADVTAVDIKPQGKVDQTLFKGIQADIIDLVEENRLGQVVDPERKGFDIIFSEAFVGYNHAPELLDRFRKDSEQERLEQLLFDQCFEMLKEGGIIHLALKNKTDYTKKNGQLVPL